MGRDLSFFLSFFPSYSVSSPPLHIRGVFLCHKSSDPKENHPYLAERIDHYPETVAFKSDAATDRDSVVVAGGVWCVPLAYMDRERPKERLWWTM